MMRGKRLLAYALAMVVAMSNSQMANAAEISQDKAVYGENNIDAVGAEITSGDYTYTVNSDGASATITKYLGSESSVNIPEKIDKYLVTGLDNAPFVKNLSVKTINVPKTIYYMGIYDSCIAGGASNLENIFVDDNNPVYYDENGVLFKRVSYGNILSEYPEGKSKQLYKVSNNVAHIGMGAFYGTKNVKKLYISSTLKSIGSHAFMNGKMEVFICASSSMKFASDSFNHMLSGTKIIVPNAEMKNKVTAAIYPVGSSNVEVINLADASDEDKAKYSSPATSLSFADGSKSKNVTWDANKTYTLYDLYKITSAQDFCTETVNWTVSDTNMATVDNAAQTVKIKERSGDFDLTGTTDSGSFSIVLHIKAYVPTKSCTAPADIETSIGGSGSFALTFDPVTAYAAASVTWASSNPDVVSVTSEKMTCGDNREGVSVVANYMAKSVGQSLITATVDDNGNKYTKCFKITIFENIEKCTIDKIPTYYYDYFVNPESMAKPEPDPVLRCNGIILQRGKDYTVSYRYEYVNFWRSWVKIEGIGSYRGSREVSFSMFRKNIDMSEVTINLSQNIYKFNDMSCNPAVVVTYQGMPLTEKVDYLLSYQNNYFPGTASVVIRGFGNNTGEQRVNFTITPKSSHGGTGGNTGTDTDNDNTDQEPAITGVKDSYVKSFGDKAFTIKATGKGKISYASSNKKVATIGSSNGKIALKSIGSATITIKSSDAVKKVTIQVVPKKPSLKKAAASGKKAIKVNWGKDSKVTGYQIQVSTSSKFSKGNKTYTVKKNKTTSYTVKKLTSKKKYYVQMRSYKTVSGKKYYSSWSSKKTVRVK